MSRANIVLFGSTGAGKSSVVNMLCDSNKRAAPTSNGARGCTLESVSYDTNILGIPARLWDTAGLDEGDDGSVPHIEAVVNLYKLLRNLAGGVHLLIFVLRAPRITGSAKSNWDFFRETVCQRQVPAVIVITCLESEDVLDQWWWNNKAAFDRYGIEPEGFACVAANRGKPLGKGRGHKFDEEYEDSQIRVKQLIMKKCLQLGRGWSMPPAKWFETIVEITWESKSLKSKRVETSRIVETRAFKDMIDGLRKICGMSESEAREIMKKLH